MPKKVLTGTWLYGDKNVLDKWLEREDHINKPKLFKDSSKEKHNKVSKLSMVEAAGMREWI